MVTELCTLFFANLLLQYSLIGFFQLIFKSSKIIFNYIISQILRAMTLKSTSALHLGTTFCFLLLQVTKFPLRRVQYLR